MTETTKIRKNAMYSLLSIVSRLIANVLLFLVIARYFGPSTFGQFTFAHTLSFIFILFADFGIDILFTNEIARDRKNIHNLFQQYLTIKFCFITIAFLGMLLFAFLANISSQTRVLVIIFSIYMVLTTSTNFLFALYKGVEKLKYESKVSLYTNFGLLILTILLLFIKSDILLIASGFVISRIIGFVLALKYSFIILHNIAFKLTFSGIEKLKKKVFIWGSHLVFNYLFFQLDTLLLALWKNDFEVGIYQSVFKLILLPLLIPDILVNTLTPVLARLNVENQQQWKKIGHIMNKVLFITIIPITLILFLFAEDIIQIVYGRNNYLSAIPVLKIFAFVIFVRFNTEAFALMLTTSNRQVIRMKVVIFAAFLNLGLNYYMIPAFGVKGAALVSLITNIFVGAMYGLYNLPLFVEWIVNIKTIAIVILSSTIVFIFFLFTNLSIFIGVPIILISYFSIAYYYFFTKAENKILLPNGLLFPRVE